MFLKYACLIVGARRYGGGVFVRKEAELEFQWDEFVLPTSLWDRLPRTQSNNTDSGASKLGRQLYGLGKYFIFC